MPPARTRAPSATPASPERCGLVSIGPWERKAFTAVSSWYVTTQEYAMNAFYEHHQNSIVMHYACFDRILLDARIPAFLDGARAMGFFSQHRGLFPVYKKHLVKISADYEKWVDEQIR